MQYQRQLLPLSHTWHMQIAYATLNHSKQASIQLKLTRSSRGHSRPETFSVRIITDMHSCSNTHKIQHRGNGGTNTTNRKWCLHQWSPHPLQTWHKCTIGIKFRNTTPQQARLQEDRWPGGFLIIQQRLPARDKVLFCTGKVQIQYVKNVLHRSRVYAWRSQIQYLARDDSKG